MFKHVRALTAAVTAGLLLASCAGGLASAPATPTLPVSLRSVETFFRDQGASRWVQAPSSGSEYEVVTTAETYCSVTVKGPVGTDRPSQIGMVCHPPTDTNGHVEVAVPADEVGLVKATVRRFDPGDYPSVAKVRTVAAASSLSTVAAFRKGTPRTPTVVLSLSVNSSPPPGSGIPVVNLFIGAEG